MLKVKKEIALNAFDNNFNCAQSVLKTIALNIDFDMEQAMQIASAFGGGMGRQQKTCGALTGAYMAIGLYSSKHIRDESTRKEKNTELIQALTQEFNLINGATDCGKLLNVDLNTEKGQKEFEARKLGENVCKKCIESSIELLDKMLSFR